MQKHACASQPGIGMLMLLIAFLQLSDTATCLLSTKDKTACVLLASPGAGNTPPVRQTAIGVIQSLYRIESGELLADFFSAGSSCSGSD